jgi:hypothetical protein
VEPRHVAWRDLQIDDPQRTVLEYLPVMRLLVNRHHRRLALSGLVCRLPGGCLSLQPGCGGKQRNGDERHQRDPARHGDSFNLLIYPLLSATAVSSGGR